ncbi:DUF2500 domain-containing protein [Niallia nealsonii]|uniref:DUF2500 domain-containing protein n=1 Tax=Niallia nealsonii TaxID=115979 RepID=A0A2N0Z5D1_9BACI|nr:DUF2500 domain-containing protein [Niallia nealsonii]PKG24699.1 DUF2500 domain-containing protein [Niallia nealsonii]
MGFDDGFSIFDNLLFNFGPIFMVIIFALVIGGFIYAIFKGVKQWNHNNGQPKLSVQAKVVTKRTAVRGGGETTASTDYYVTFEYSSGDRSEFEVAGNEFGLLVEGDAGELHFQGTRYQGFTRNREIVSNQS